MSEEKREYGFLVPRAGRAQTMDRYGIDEFPLLRDDMRAILATIQPQNDRTALVTVIDFDNQDEEEEEEAKALFAAVEADPAMVPVWE